MFESVCTTCCAGTVLRGHQWEKPRGGHKRKQRNQQREQYRDRHHRQAERGSAPGEQRNA